MEEEYEREEDGQFAGLLVKNLEIIQGDERDVILLSVCYGYGPDGRMLMNFGPIKQGGGEKRLNVAFSRAKKHMAVVSSIQYLDIKNVYNDGANSLRGYLQYAAAMSSGDFALARVVLRTLNPGGGGSRPDDAAKDTVVAALARALEARGLEAALAVGHSHFRSDLALKRPGEPAYSLAVFVDTDAYYREHDVLERDVLRPRLLRSFGWKVLHVLAKDWLEDPQVVVRRVEDRFTGGMERIVEPPTGEAEPLSDRDVWLEAGASAVKPSAPNADPPVAPPSSTRLAPEATAPARETAPAPPTPRPSPAAEPPSPPTPAPSGVPRRISQLLPGQTRYFEFVGGTSKKYWHVTVNGTELVVSFGRIGTAGQLKRKSFPNEAMARHEAESLIREKIGKGYQEVHPE